MARLDNVLDELGYFGTPFYRRNIDEFEPESAHIFRSAQEMGVDGIYVFQSDSSNAKRILPSRPAVFIAETDNDSAAHRIHRNLWNLKSAPFILLLTDDFIRIYTGFDYSERDWQQGLLDIIPLRRAQIRTTLADFTASSIDSGQIWRSSKYGSRVNPRSRVDYRLLKNLFDLGKALESYGQLPPTVAHSLIGKYVYIRYLWDRGILTEEWLLQNGISKQEVLGRNANKQGLFHLIEALEDRFNGHVFPLSQDEQVEVNDDHVALAAGVFMGDLLDVTPSRIAQQLHFDFQAYNFRYLPVETLSSVYEQFIEDKKQKGAIYTPEVLADYLLSEVNAEAPLTSSTRILDPACGSGIFLVLAYRRLIEDELAKRADKKIPLNTLKDLLGNIYGIEKELDACYVAEFSLILTLLNYIEPRELHKNSQFKFPDLHGNNIFHGDFFDDTLQAWLSVEKFDWIIGNPPWVRADASQALAVSWIARNKGTKPIGTRSVAEAFSWRVGELISQNGVAGLIMPATALVNLNSEQYRKAFFSSFLVKRITNFANFRENLFEKRGTLPAATMIYTLPKDEVLLDAVIHYGPFTVNQAHLTNNEIWTITINESEIKKLSYEEVRKGLTATWKIALWGNSYDAKVLSRLRRLFPNSLEQFCDQRSWGKRLPRQGAEFTTEEQKPIAKINGLQRFDTERFSNLEYRPKFDIPSNCLFTIQGDSHVRRGEDALLLTTPAPHIIISKGWDYIIFSDVDFIIPPQQMGIAAPKSDTDTLMALATYLNSSIAKYYLFFQVPEWGFFRNRDSVVVTQVRTIPTPNMQTDQVQALANLYRTLQKEEREAFTSGDAVRVVALQDKQQELIDFEVRRVFEVPEDISFFAEEFTKIRLSLDSSRANLEKVIRPATRDEVFVYAQELQHELDDFAMGSFFHRINITLTIELIECVIEIVKQDVPIPVSETDIAVGDQNTIDLLEEIKRNATEQVSQWIYVQRGLRLFDGPRIFLYKSPRLINWTRTQAIIDAGDIITQAITVGLSHNDIYQA